MDAYWNRLKKDLEQAADSYGKQDNTEAHQKAKTLRSVLRTMEEYESDSA